MFGAPPTTLLGADGRTDEEYNAYLLDLLTKIQNQKQEEARRSLVKGTPEAEVLGPGGTGSTMMLAPADIGSDSSEFKAIADADEKMYASVNRVMPKWFTELDNKVRKTDKKLQKYDGRKLINKVSNKLKKPLNKGVKKLKKKLKKLF